MSDGRVESVAFTVVSWNIRFGIEIDAAIDVLRRNEDIADADIILLQELDGDGACRVAVALGADLYYRPACRHPQTGREFGNAILVRGSMSDERLVRLPHQAPVRGTPRIAVGATASVAGRRVSLWCTHTEIPAMRQSQRRGQYERLAEIMALDDASHLVVGGDFNTVTRRGIVRLDETLSRSGVARVATSSLPTFRRVRRGMALDHLFVRGLQVRRSGVGDLGAASDHAPIWAELEPVTEVE